MQPLLKPADKCWQPTDFLPPSEDPYFMDQVRSEQRRALGACLQLCVALPFACGRDALRRANGSRVPQVLELRKRTAGLPDEYLVPFVGEPRTPMGFCGGVPSERGQPRASAACMAARRPERRMWLRGMVAVHGGWMPLSETARGVGVGAPPVAAVPVPRRMPYGLLSGRALLTPSAPNARPGCGLQAT